MLLCKAGEEDVLQIPIFKSLRASLRLGVFGDTYLNDATNEEFELNALERHLLRLLQIRDNRLPMAFAVYLYIDGITIYANQIYCLFQTILHMALPLSSFCLHCTFSFPNFKQSVRQAAAFRIATTSYRPRIALENSETTSYFAHAPVTCNV
jgi:hypothetical protein